MTEHGLTTHGHSKQTRRAFLRLSLATPAALLFPAPEALAQVRPTPACGDDGDLTPLQTAGPFFTPKASSENN